MPIMKAYEILFAMWGTPTWKRLPEDVCKALGYRSDIGVVSFTICTKTGAEGMNNFLALMNRNREER